jgi:hypothetical protein
VPAHRQLAPLDRAAEHRFARAQLAPHPRPLAALTREDERDPRPARRGVAGEDSLDRTVSQEALQPLGQLGGVAAEQTQPPGVVHAARRRAVGDVIEPFVGPGPRQARSVGAGHRRERGRVTGRQQQRSRAGRRRRVYLPGRGRLLEDDVGVGAAQAEGAHRGQPRRVAARPAPRRAWNLGRDRRQVEPRVQRSEARLGRHVLVSQHQRDLDQPGHAGRGV